MARRDAENRRSRRANASTKKPLNSALILHAAIDALHWRLCESANRIADAEAALLREHHAHAMDHLFALEPLVFEAERILSATFLLANETQDRMEA